MRETPYARRLALQFEGICRAGGVRHVFTTRDREGGGNLALSGGRDREAALQERAFWSEWLGVSPDHWVVGGQVHGAEVAVVDESHRGRGATDPEKVIPATDGLVTTTPGLPLYVAVGDCAAVLLVVKEPTPAIAVLHAGWRGTAAGILGAGVDTLCAVSGAEPASVLAGIAPCIGLNSFEVGDEVAELAPPARKVRFGERWHVDLPGWVNDQLRTAGLPQGNIEVSGLDSADRPDLLFSHRRDGAGAGRNGLIACLEKTPR